MSKKVLSVTQADGSVWYVDWAWLDAIMAVAIEDGEFDARYYEHEFAVVIFAETLTWAQVLPHAEQRLAADPNGPDLGWGWTHGPKTWLETAS